MKPLDYIKGDIYRYSKKSSVWSIILNLINSNRSFKYVFWFRLLKSNSFFIRSVAKIMHRHLSIKYNIQIPKEVEIGPGLYIGHATSVIINATAVIGKNCNLSPFSVIGANHGQAAIVGDNCYIGPNVNLVENVKIGDNAVIGAGSVVIKDVPSMATAVGNPARIVKKSNANNYICNPV